MKTQLLTILACGLFVGSGPARADEQADATALLNKAMKAMNGEAKLAKLGTVAAKGKITASEGNFSLDIEGTWQGMSQYRADVEVQDGGNNFKGVLVLNGDKGWLKKMDDTNDAPEAMVPFIQNIFYAARMPQLLPAFKDKAYKLSPLGEIMVGTQAAIGLAISHPDRKDVSLYFDKDKGLPIKSEVRLTEPRGDKEITIEFQYSDYKDFDGVMLSGKIMFKLDDKEFTIDLSEIKAINKVDDSHFDRP